MLLDRVANREAQIEIGTDGGTIRKFLERLATKARSAQDGLGSLSSGSINQAFRDVCGYYPNEEGMVLLQRLPGLGIHLDEEHSRTFIDEDFADTCRAGDLTTFVESPFDFPLTLLADMESSIGSLGIKIASRKAEQRGLTQGHINAALQHAQRHDAEHMKLDLIRLLQELGFDLLVEVQVRGPWLRDFELDPSGIDLSKLRFEDCFFNASDRIQAALSVMVP